MQNITFSFSSYRTVRRRHIFNHPRTNVFRSICDLCSYRSLEYAKSLYETYCARPRQLKTKVFSRQHGINGIHVGANRTRIPRQQRTANRQPTSKVKLMDNDEVTKEEHELTFETDKANEGDRAVR